MLLRDGCEVLHERRESGSRLLRRLLKERNDREVLRQVRQAVRERLLLADEEREARLSPIVGLTPRLLLRHPQRGQVARATAGGTPTLRLGMHRQRADCAFGEILTFNSQGMVVTGAVVFPGNG